MQFFGFLFQVTNNLLAPSKAKSDEKPVLRRERTFDMDPKMSLRQVKKIITTYELTEEISATFSFKMSIPIDSPTTSDQSSENTQICNINQDGNGNQKDGKTTDPVSGLEMFQQQRLIHTQKLKMEILKLEKMEQTIASSKQNDLKVSKLFDIFIHLTM